MVKPEIISETPTNMVELKEELANIKKRGKEITMRVGKTEEHLNMFVNLSIAKERELFDKLMKLDIPRLKEVHINKIIDLLPNDINYLKTILQGYAVTVSNENLKKILDTIKAVTEKTEK